MKTEITKYSTCVKVRVLLQNKNGTRSWCSANGRSIRTAKIALKQRLKSDHYSQYFCV